MGTQKWDPFSIEPVEYLPLNFDFHPKAVQGWLSASGFQVINNITVSHFRIGLFKKIFPPGLLASLDSLLGRTGNLWQYSPSVFVLSRAAGANFPVEAGFFRCPACGGLDLTEGEISGEHSLECRKCKIKYPIRDGIYDFKEPIFPSGAGSK
jgi:hypothetical protein